MPRMVGCAHSATHEPQGAFDHLRCPRSQTDAPFLARIEVAREEAFDVLRVMGEGEQVSLDGFRMLDVRVRTIFRPLSRWSRRSYRSRGKGIWMDAIRVQSMIPEAERATRSFGQR